MTTLALLRFPACPTPSAAGSAHPLPNWLSGRRGSNWDAGARLLGFSLVPGGGWVVAVATAAFSGKATSHSRSKPGR